MRGCCVFLFRLRGPVLIPVAGGWQASLAAANLLWIHKVAVERQLEEARRKSKEATAQLKVIRDMLESSQTQQEAEHKQVQALTSAFTDKVRHPRSVATPTHRACARARRCSRGLRCRAHKNTFRRFQPLGFMGEHGSRPPKSHR
jgi:hypothetical protein